MNVEESVRQGLMSNPKYIPTWYKYDKTGSILYEEYAEKSQYYYFRKYEKSLLAAAIKEIVMCSSAPCSLMDLGCGTSEKTRLLIDCILEHQNVLQYIPVDISKEFLLEVCENLSNHYGNRLEVQPCPADFMVGIQMMRKIEKNILLVCFGSLQNGTYQDQIKVLTAVAANLKDHDYFLVSLDITADEAKIMDAYLDPAGYAERFYLNSVDRLNRELRGNVDLSNFTIHRSYYHNEDTDRYSSAEVFLKAKEKQIYRLEALDMDLTFEKDERLNLYDEVGISHKFTTEQVQNLTRKCSLEIHKMWKNEHVALLLLKRGH